MSVHVKRRQGKKKRLCSAAAAAASCRTDEWKPARERVLHQHRQAFVWQSETDRHKGDRRSCSLSVSHTFTRWEVNLIYQGFG